MVEQLENAPPEDQQAALLSVVAVLLHETIHYGRDQYFDPDNKMSKDEVSSFVNYLTGDEAGNYQIHVNRANTDEAGEVFEYAAYGIEFGDGVNGTEAKDYLEDAKAYIRGAQSGIFNTGSVPTVPKEKSEK